MYLAIAKAHATGEILYFGCSCRRRFKRVFRKASAEESLELLEKGITEERRTFLLIRDRSIRYRTGTEVMYAGESFTYRGRDHWRDGPPVRYTKPPAEDQWE